jgi:hypothetical protein
MASPLDRPEVAALLDGSPYADVGVDTRTGPHVTPAAFAAAGGRLWVVSSRRTVRVRAIRRTGHAAVLARQGDRAVVVAGRARVLSVWRRSEAIALLAGGATAAHAAAAYTLRNAGTVLAGFVADLVMGAGDPTVYDRVLVEIQPDRGMLLDGPEVRDGWGRWQGRAQRSAPPRAHAVVAAELGQLARGVPPAVAALLETTRTASLGWSTPGGCVVLPADATAQAGRLQAASAALDLAGAASGALACATLHDSPGRRPSTFRGAVVRGEGRIVRRGTARTRVALLADRVSWWSGFESGTARSAVAAQGSVRPRAAA